MYFVVCLECVVYVNCRPVSGVWCLLVWTHLSHVKLILMSLFQYHKSANSLKLVIATDVKALLETVGDGDMLVRLRSAMHYLTQQQLALLEIIEKTQSLQVD